MLSKPRDPRKHGLKEPLQMLTDTHEIDLFDLEGRNGIPISALVKASNKIIKDVSLLSGYSIVIPPSIVHYDEWNVSLKYSTEHPNPNYATEKQAYDAQVAKYEAEMLAYEQEKAIFKLDDNNPRKLDAQIEGIENRLARLKEQRAKLND